MSLQFFSIRLTRVLTASVRMQYDILQSAESVNDLPYRIYAQLFLHVVMHLKCYDLSIKAIQHCR